LRNNPHVTPNADDIVVDLGLWVPIEQMDPNIRDAVGRSYKADFSYDHLCLRDQIDIFIGEVRNDSSFANCHDFGELAIKMVQTERHSFFNWFIASLS